MCVEEIKPSSGLSSAGVVAKKEAVDGSIAIVAPLVAHLLLKALTDQASSSGAFDPKDVQRILQVLADEPISSKVSTFERLRLLANQKYRREIQPVETQSETPVPPEISPSDLKKLFGSGSKQYFPASLNSWNYRRRISKIREQKNGINITTAFVVEDGEDKFCLVKKNEGQFSLEGEVEPIITPDVVVYLAKPAGRFPNTPVQTEAIYIQSINDSSSDKQPPSAIPIGDIHRINHAEVGLNLDQVCSLVLVNETNNEKVLLYLIDLTGKNFSSSKKSLDQKYCYQQYELNLQEISKLLRVDLWELNNSSMKLHPWKFSEKDETTMILQFYLFDAFYTVLATADLNGDITCQNIRDVLLDDDKTSNNEGFSESKQYRVHEVLEWENEFTGAKDKFIFGTTVKTEENRFIEQEWSIIDQAGRVVTKEVPDKITFVNSVSFKKSLLAGRVTKPRVITISCLSDSEENLDFEMVLPEYNGASKPIFAHEGKND